MQCKYCNRKYKIKTYYDRHILACEIMSKTTKERLQDEECMADTPNIRKVYDIVLEMNKQLQELREKVKELEKEKKEKKKKINVLDWLNNQTTKPSVYWSDLLNALEIKREDVLHIFKTDISRGIFQRLCDECERHDILPVQAYEQKPGILYVYDKEGWRDMKDTCFESSIKILHKKYMKEFVAWQTDAEKILGTTEFNKQFTENIHKLNNKTITQLSKKTLQELHKHTKVNIKDIIQLEIE